MIEIKIYNGRMLVEKHSLSPGRIVASKKQLLVATENGYLEITDLKMSGKKRMDAISLLNGYAFEKDARMF